MTNRVHPRTPFWAAAALLTAALLPAAAGQQAWVGSFLPEVERRTEQDLEYVTELYKDVHQNPELAFEEVRTAARVAAEMRQLGLEVTERVGRTGVVAVLRNGEGPTVLIRADMDALPVKEATGLPWASTATTRDADGNEVPLMHACGHDVHVACLIGTARVLAGLKERWSGTLVFIAQPAEEIGGGAREMLEDGLFTRFPRPDYALALHTGVLATGQVGFTEGPERASVDTVTITVHGRGGHGSAPHTTVDPVVLAAKIILDLQTIVAREVNPLEPAVVTVGSIHGGTRPNIIPNEVKLELTVRAHSEEVRQQLLKGIERIAKGQAATAGAPEPEVAFRAYGTPPVVNDVELTRRTVAVWRQVFGEENVVGMPRSMGGEDFARYGREGVPAFIYRVGIFPPELVREYQEAGRPLPSSHSNQYAPREPEQALRTGTVAMSMAALNLLNRR